MQKLKTILIALAAASTLTVPAMAASGSWTDAKTHPVIGQSNWWYNGPTFTAPTGVPSTALVSTVSISWGYKAATSHPNNPTPYTMNAIACRGTLKCGQFPWPEQPTNDTFWSGENAKGDWTFKFNAVSPQTKVFFSSLVQSKPLNLTVNYTY